MRRNDLQQVLIEWRNQVDAHLKTICAGKAEHDVLMPVVSYSLFGGGKRLRPLLLIALCSDLGIALPRVLNVAAAIELLHCSSLIHDDLPALDNDNFRRGNPSCHKRFSEAEAILAGDFMLVLALNQVAGCETLEAVQRNRIAVLLSDAFMKLCAGQKLDLLADGESLTLINRLKTGALFAASLSSAAIIADLSDDAQRAASEAGVILGEVFQAVDDCADGDSADDTGTGTRAEVAQVLLNTVDSLVDRIEKKLAHLKPSMSGASFEINFPATDFMISRITAGAKAV